MAKRPDTSEPDGTKGPGVTPPPAPGMFVGAPAARRGRFVLTTPVLRAILIGGLIGIGMLLVALAILRRLPY